MADFAPASAVNADLYLRWERAFSDLAIHGGARETGTRKNGL